MSLIFRSHVLGRGIELLSLVKSTLESLFFFSGLIAIINLFFFNFQFQLSTLAIAITLFYFLMLFYRLSLNLVLEKYRGFGGNILRCMIVGYNSHGVHMYEELIKFPEFGYRSSGLFTFDSKVTKKINNITFQGKIIDLGAQKVDYLECLNIEKLELCKNSKTNFKIFIAYYIGNVRLIDNL